MIRATLVWLGGVEILVYSVGGSAAAAGGALELTYEDWQHTLQLNLFSAVRLDRGLLPAMLLQGAGGSSM